MNKNVFAVFSPECDIRENMNSAQFPRAVSRAVSVSGDVGLLSEVAFISRVLCWEHRLHGR